jgi:hypothetical protein
MVSLDEPVFRIARNVTLIIPVATIHPIRAFTFTH